MYHEGNLALRLCYTKQFFLQLATQQTLRGKLQEKFSCNTPFCHCNCCVASCKKSRTTLYFSQHCETSCLRVTSHLQLATQFCQNGPIRSQDVGDLACPPSCLLYALQVAKKVANVWHPLCNLKGFLFVIVTLQVARKIASCNMAFRFARHTKGERGVGNVVSSFLTILRPFSHTRSFLTSRIPLI